MTVIYVWTDGRRETWEDTRKEDINQVKMEKFEILEETIVGGIKILRKIFLVMDK